MSREGSETGSSSRSTPSRGGGWRAAAELARGQHGVVALGQLVACGFSAPGVESLVQAGRLHRIHREVYSLSPAALGGLGLKMAAVLACGSTALLAARSAAGHLGLIANTSPIIDVMATRRVRRPGIRAHRMALLESRDRTEHLGIPCTSIARTMLDIAWHGRPGELGNALDQAVELGVFDLNAVEDVIARNPGQRGVRRLRLAIQSMAVGRPAFRSELERRFLPIARSAGLPQPLINHVIMLDDGPIEVDFYWPDLRLVVETDGFRDHGRIRAFKQDRRRDRRLAAIGIHSLRYVWDDLVRADDVRRELIAIRDHLAARRQKPAPPAG